MCQFSIRNCYSSSNLNSFVVVVRSSSLIVFRCVHSPLGYDLSRLPESVRVDFKTETVNGSFRWSLLHELGRLGVEGRRSRHSTLLWDIECPTRLLFSLLFQTTSVTVWVGDWLCVVHGLLAHEGKWRIMSFCAYIRCFLYAQSCVYDYCLICPCVFWDRKDPFSHGPVCLP